MSVIKGKKEIQELENMLTQLIHEYDMFFRGHQKVEPTAKRKMIKAKLNKLFLTRVNNTIIKQKVTNFSQKFALYQRKWDQIWLEIEKGTYKIDRYKMKLHQKLKSPPKPKENLSKIDDYKSLLNKYVTTQKLLGVNKIIDYDKLSKKLHIQKQKIKNKYKCKDVDFKVIVKDGKATIKPILVK